MTKRHLLLPLFFVHCIVVNAAGESPFISHHHVPRGFAVAEKAYVASIIMSDSDWPGAMRTGKHASSGRNKLLQNSNL